MLQLLCLVLFTFTASSQAVELPLLPFRMQKIIGKTFHHAGPNCFAAALYGADVYSSFRGVSESEFSEVIKAACVEVDSPEFGDVGTYKSKGFGFVHAFSYLDKESAFEKPGVDYVGGTPIRIQKQSHIDYVHLASQDCRRYGDESCHNRKTFYRCGEVFFSPQFGSILQKVNSLLDEVLQSENISLQLQDKLHRLHWTIEQESESDLERAILKSIQKQVEFFKFETQKMLIF